MAERDESVVAEPAWVWGLVFVGFPVLGAGLGLLLRLAAGWLADRPRLPVPGWLTLIDRVAEPWATASAVVLGLVAGIVLALIAHSESLSVAVSAARVALTRGEETTEIARRQISTVFLDGKQLVLLGTGSEELAREQCDLDHSAIEHAFTEHGYPWRPDGDPYRDSYRRWVPGTPDLPPGAEAVLRTREKALSKNDKDDAADLRAELGRLGLVVRDGKSRQYWRRHSARVTGENPDPS